ncbi:MAG: ribonuclease III [Thiotrichaceae bacterium]|nr:ribonuclease III [Thiotrichaceae bacterium]
MKESDLQKLYQILGYQFQQPTHLKTALTHRSAGNPNNERLEFLGDALLSLIIGEFLFQRFPKAKEGQLTRLRASLVKGETLAEIALELELGQYLRLGMGELRSGGWRRNSTLADAVEAIIGAIYIDSDLFHCRKVVLAWFETRLSSLSISTIEKDPKTRLQEHLQARQQPLPDYQVLKMEGPPHNQHFEVKCQVVGLKATIGSGESRRRAEQAAAEKALKLLKKHTKFHKKG